MTKKEYIVGPIIVAVIAMAVQVIDQTSILNILAIGAGFGWVSFQAWACYFLAGCTPKGGIRTFNSYLLGCIASIAIMILGGTLSQVLGFFRISNSNLNMCCSCLYVWKNQENGLILYRLYL